MNKPLVTDELWEIIEPLLPQEPPKPKGGRPRVPDRAALTGIIFVLRSGLPWEMLPQEMGCGSGVTCWRRLRDWQDAGGGSVAQATPSITQQTWRSGQDRLVKSQPGQRYHRCQRRKKGGLQASAIGRNPTDKGKPGTKRHVVVEAKGIQLWVKLTGANVNDAVVFEEMIDSIEPVSRPRGQ